MTALLSSVLIGETAATIGNGAVEITLNYFDNSTVIRCRHYGTVDVTSGKHTCYCPDSYVLAPDGIACIGIIR